MSAPARTAAADELSESAAELRARDCRAPRRARRRVPDSSCRTCRSMRAASCARRSIAQGIALVQMVTPVTPPERLATLCAASQGFVYAVTMTGHDRQERRRCPTEVLDYLDRVRALRRACRCARASASARASRSRAARPRRWRRGRLGAGRGARAGRLRIRAWLRALRPGAETRGRLRLVGRVACMVRRHEDAHHLPRFCGSPTSQRRLFRRHAAAAGRAVTVRLLQPPPLDRLFTVGEEAAGALRVWREQVPSAGAPAVSRRSPARPEYLEAVEASRGYAGFRHHRFPSCFVRHAPGARGRPADFGGPIPELGIVAAPWSRSLARSR